MHKDFMYKSATQRKLNQDSKARYQKISLI